ncbi:hypothetical protein AN639_03210 [Candidatus Epulonipiscium fishelsonii]|uniref:Uncharacterized protein n=1 Tax=Candidatus Epulonipiscium fishelsonii TaxID=77094 RepID=A0ACC8XG80_9FIRM|nr:hypothetical protein AN639_03210 [Epulopiscium sp. SCG-B05WGA-EpuloA1]ONI42625.1 hypothetical protein AN396_13665 [Epulopiscium sp. SCG-B11WGA-EpuloA1]
MVRLAKIDDIDRIVEIKNLAIAQMGKNNIYQWNELYPTKEDFLCDIKNETLYVVEENSKIGAAACIDQNIPSEYKDASFWSSNAPAYTMHRLVVDPLCTKKGYASLLMNKLEEIALYNNVTNIQIDTFSQNYLAQNLFRKHGYIYVGDVHFRAKIEPFYCFEKMLT